MATLRGAALAPRWHACHAPPTHRLCTWRLLHFPHPSPSPTVPLSNTPPPSHHHLHSSLSTPLLPLPPFPTSPLLNNSPASLSPYEVFLLRSGTLSQPHPTFPNASSYPLPALFPRSTGLSHRNALGINRTSSHLPLRQPHRRRPRCLLLLRRPPPFQFLNRPQKHNSLHLPPPPTH